MNLPKLTILATEGRRALIRYDDGYGQLHHVSVSSRVVNQELDEGKRDIARQCVLCQEQVYIKGDWFILQLWEWLGRRDIGGAIKEAQDAKVAEAGCGGRHDSMLPVNV